MKGHINEFGFLKIKLWSDEGNFNAFNLIVWIAIITFLIFNALRFYFKNKRKIEVIKRKKEQLQETNFLLRESINKQELLLKETHHRVKNNLQIVMSLLDIQAKNTTKVNLIKFIENSRSRIAAMALIHQNLYLSNSTSCISFHEYLEELTQSIINCYGKKAIVIKIDSKGIILDLDIAIPLGLIINELVCNALKHGFQNIDIDNTINIAIKNPTLNHYILTVSDNGIGMTQLSNKKSKSIGLELVELLVLQIQGTIQLSKNLKRGTQYQIIFKHNPNVL